ncbi:MULTISPECIES: Co2+/Mg2+ efflux protein ApaG [unclassified Methylophaga]|jgi:ApaG protein|uniref:Co2+/Mg2+ efflux protein ApaG n=1 Tax=unclassified Methylophaga TaxID=2629249 RepID=UPI000C3AEAD9|nr:MULTISPECIES: Co2+/Mg2+ efflux protein ApaG [unclassified Methylophaga]MAX52505.1 Co2+/Mg2+ efflux protein ApaG [Methylophaga sp.]|tara:strand:- start:6142 stop:6522 length:381 start_codon:yes stop_codon:yes gene_type:complete
MNEHNNDISVDVETTYLDEESDPEKARYLFAYTITIKNQSQSSARLLSRYWKITGGDGHEQEVEGDGVVGLHPYLAPEQEFTYTSAAMLDTPVGMMQGHYKMLGDNGERFEVNIPAFTLAVPRTLH